MIVFRKDKKLTIIELRSFLRTLFKIVNFVRNLSTKTLKKHLKIAFFSPLRKHFGTESFMGEFWVGGGIGIAVHCWSSFIRYDRAPKSFAHHLQFKIPSKNSTKKLLQLNESQEYRIIIITDYFFLLRTRSTSTAHATEQPTIGLLPIPRNPIIST